MRKFILSFSVISVLAISCTKSVSDASSRNPINEAPTIKVITPTVIPSLKAGDELFVKALLTDRDLISVASWEAINAAVLCGNNPYKGEFKPMVYDFEMNFKFLVPSGFTGDQVIRIYGVDGSGNISTFDLAYKVTN